MAKKTLLSPPEAFFQKRSGEFLDPGISIPVPQVSSPEERASMEAEFERRSRAAEIQAQEPRNPSPLTSADVNPQIVFLPVKSLEVSPWNARPAPLDGEALQDLMYAISREGIQSPLHVYPLPEKPGRYAILDGQRRFRAAVSLGLQETPAVVHDAPEPSKAYLLSYMLSDTGEKPDILDNAIMWKRFIDEGIVSTYEDLSLLLGITQGMISRTLQFYKLSPGSQSFLLERRGAATWRMIESLYKAEARYGDDKVVQALQAVEGKSDLAQVLLQLDKSESKQKRRYTRMSIREPIVLEDTVVGTVHRVKGRLTVDLPHLEFDDELARRVVEAVKISLSDRIK